MRRHSLTASGGSTGWRPDACWITPIEASLSLCRPCRRSKICRFPSPYVLAADVEAFQAVTGWLWMWAYRPACKQGRLLHCLRFGTKMPVRYRRAKPEEIPHALRLLEPDRPLFSSSTWTALPQLLKDLLERERILLCVIEEPDSHNLRFVGGSGFLTSTFLRAALDHPTENILELAFAAECAQQPVFLNVKQVAAANRSGDLRLLIFFGTTGSLDPGDPKASI